MRKEEEESRGAGNKGECSARVGLFPASCSPVSDKARDPSPQRAAALNTAQRGSRLSARSS